MDSGALGAIQRSRLNTFFKGSKIRSFLPAVLSLSAHAFVFFLVYVLFKNLNFDKPRVMNVTIYSTLPSRASPLSKGNAKKPAKIKNTLPAKGAAPLAPQKVFSEGTKSHQGAELKIDVPYPKLSRLLREEGEVIFAVSFDEKKFNYERFQSSGFARLDSAAETALIKNFNSPEAKERFNKFKKIRFLFSLKGS